METSTDLVLGRKTLRHLDLRSGTVTGRGAARAKGHQRKHSRSEPARRDSTNAGIFRHGVVLPDATIHRHIGAQIEVYVMLLGRGGKSLPVSTLLAPCSD